MQADTQTSAAVSESAADGQKPVLTVVIIPAYNEERFIGSVVLRAIRCADTVLVVDDGSSDATAEIAEAAGAIVVRHTRNVGKGAALNTALGTVRELNPLVVIMLDGDGQHVPEEIQSVVAPILAGAADIAVGSRYLENTSKVPVLRIWGHHAFNFITNEVSGVHLSDSQSGFRAFSAKALEAMRFDSNGFSVESEMQFLASQCKLKMIEVPITIRYDDRPKRPLLVHGLMVLSGILRLIGQYRPMLFFGLAGLVLMLVGLGWGLYVVNIYLKYKSLAVGYALLSVLLTLCGILSLFTGIVLHSIRGLLTETNWVTGETRTAGSQMNASDPIAHPVPVAQAGTAANKPPVTVVAPAKRWAALSLRELWEYRDLLYFWIWRNLKVRYKQTVLGASWAIIQPFLTMIVFSIFFGQLAGMPSDGVPYPIFAYCALVPWTYFANSVSLASNSLVEHESVITKVYFPRLFAPLAAVLTGLVDLAIAFIFLVFMMFAYGISPTAAIWTLPFFILLAALAALGVGLWLSTLNVQYRDVRHAVPFLLQLWLFATPIAYPSSLVPESWRALYGLNPMAGVVEGFRWALLGQTPPSLQLLAVSTLTVVAACTSGLYYFRWTERTFADLI